jgi:hypothetical protein
VESMMQDHAPILTEARGDANRAAGIIDAL